LRNSLVFRDFRRNAEKRCLLSEMRGLETRHLAVLFLAGKWDSQEKVNRREIRDCRKYEEEQNK